MPRWPDDEDDWEDDSEADEGDDFDVSDDDDDATIPCPYCRRPIHEEAERCPHCEQYVSRKMPLRRENRGGSSSAWPPGCMLYTA